MHASNVLRWFGFPFGVGVMMETPSMKIKEIERNKQEIYRRKWTTNEEGQKENECRGGKAS
jgi:hypothetical protein